MNNNDFENKRELPELTPEEEAKFQKKVNIILAIIVIVFISVMFRDNLTELYVNVKDKVFSSNEIEENSKKEEVNEEEEIEEPREVDEQPIIEESNKPKAEVSNEINQTGSTPVVVTNPEPVYTPTPVVSSENVILECSKTIENENVNTILIYNSTRDKLLSTETEIEVVDGSDLQIKTYQMLFEMFKNNNIDGYVVRGTKTDSNYNLYTYVDLEKIPNGVVKNSNGEIINEVDIASIGTYDNALVYAKEEGLTCVTK